MFGLGSPFCLFRLGSLLYVWAGKPSVRLGWEAFFIMAGKPFLSLAGKPTLRLGWEAFFVFGLGSQKFSRLLWELVQPLIVRQVPSVC